MVRVAVEIALFAHGSHPSSGSGRIGRVGAGKLPVRRRATLRLGCNTLSRAARFRTPPGRACNAEYPGRLCPEGTARATETMFCPESLRPLAISAVRSRDQPEDRWK